MKANTNKARNFYTQGQQFAARVLCIVWLLASGSPESALATPKCQMVPVTATSPQGSSLASAPPTPGGACQLLSDTPGSLLGGSVGSSPSIDAALQRQRSFNLLSRTRDRLASRLWSPRPQKAPRTPARPVAEGVTEDSSSAAVASSPAAPADTAQDQASALTRKLVSLYSADDKLPKLIEDDDIEEQRIEDYYVKLQAVVQEQAASAESAAARDKVVGEKRAIQIEEIFDELDKEGGEPIGKVLLLGGAGIGKTTLMHYISHQWAKGGKDGLWSDKYAYLFRVRLKELLNDNWKSDYTRDDLDEHPLACFIHHCLRNQHIQLPPSKQQALTPPQADLEEIKNLLKAPASQPSILLLADGYDEIASKSQKDTIVKDIVDAILERERVIMTSRPNAADKKLRAAFDRQVESQGLDRAGIDQYIDLQFGEGPAGQELKYFLTKNRQILGMYEVPINTALLCIIWQDEEFREKLQAQSGEDLKLGELYEELVVWLGKRYMKKFEYRDHTTLTEEFILKHHPVVKTLKEVAYTSFTGEGKEQAAGTLGITGAYIANTAEKQETKIESVYQYGLLRAEGAEKELIKKTHYFIHLTFQEYLTALCLREALSETQGEGIRKVATHLAEHRNEPRYLMTLKFLAGLVSKSNDTALVQRFWEAVSCNVEGVLELGVASKVELLMHLMGQSTTNGELDKRIPNRAKLQELVDEEVVTDLARWQEQIIASGYKSAALVSKLCEVIYREQPEGDISALSAALEIGIALGIQVVEEEEQQLVRHLEKLLDSSVWQLQALAAAKLAQVLDDKVGPEQISRLLDKLVELYLGENTKQGALADIQRLAWLQADIVVEELRKSVAHGSADNRRTVQGLAIELVAGSSKELAKQLSELGQAWLQSTYPEVRSRALTLIEKLLAIDAGLAPQFLEAAKTGGKDSSSYVRSRALTLIEKLLAIDAGLAPQFLEAAKTGVKDWSSDVQSRALNLIEKLLTIDAGLAPQLLEAAKTGVKDWNSDVRSRALTLIEKLLAIDAGLAPQLLEAAKTGVKDRGNDVRSSALTLMEQLLSIDAGLAPQFLEAAKTGVKDADSYVRSSALSLMEQLLSIDAGLAPQFLEAAKTGVKDSWGSVRSRALTLIDKLLSIDAGLAPQFLEAAGVKDADSDVRYSPFPLIEKLLSIDAGLAPDLLEAAKTGVKDADSDVRLRALTLMDKLLSIDAGLAPQFLEAAKTGVKDAAWHESDVRYSAFSLMDKLLSIDAGLAPQFLEAAKTGVNDQSWRVRSSALDLIEKLLSIDAGLAPDLLEAAKTGVKDADSDVRSSALSLMEKLLAKDAGLAPDLLEAAKTGIKDRYVRSSALSLMEKLLSIDAGLAPDLLEAAKTGIKDTDFYGRVRSSALSLIDKLLSIDARLAPQFLEAAKTGVKDADSDVRSSALTLIDKLLSIDAGLAPHLLEAAKTGGKDSSSYVRSSALTLMEKLLSIDAGLAPQFLEAAKTGVKDRYVRSSALTLMEKLLSIDAGLAPQFLEAAKTGVKDRYVRSSALTLMEKLLSIDAGLAPQFLEAAKTGVENSSVRSSALTLMEKLLSIDAGLAPQFLETAKTGVKDADSDVRSSALTLMEKLLSIDAELAPQFLEAAKTGVNDQSWRVRSSALTLMEKLLSIDAGLAPDLLEAAKTGVKDADSDVRSSALTLMEKLLSIDAGLAPDLLEAAKTGVKDYDSDVRSSPLPLIDKLLSIDAGLAPQFLEVAQTGIKDSDSDVRSIALTLMEKLLSIDAGLAPDLLEAAKTGIKDSDSSVRSSALSLMEKLLAKDAGLAPQFLEVAQTGIKDKEVDVRWEAFELLRKLAEALDKPEIARDALAQLKAQLKKETWRVKRSALQTALTFTKLIPASAQHWLELIPYGLRDEDSETQEAAISLGVELASRLPDEAIIPMLLQDPELSVREQAKECFIQRLQDKTVTYSPKDLLVLDQLLHSTADSELDEALQKAITQKLLELVPQVAKEAGLEYLNEHFSKLSHSPAITAFLKKVMHQTLADNAIDQLEADFITKCILEHGITATIAPRQRRFVLEDSRYTLAEGSEASLQQIVNRVIEESKTELARQYKEHQPLFLNTGRGLPIAASDVPTAGSVVNGEDLTTNTWHLSVMHLSDHHKQEPQDTFLLLEQRNYVGEHIIKKITYDQGQYALAYDESINPNKALDTTLREELFGPMEYERTKPRYYVTCYTLSKKAAQELLGNINKQAKKEAQDAYQALHQLALAACQADQDTAGAEQLALEWGAYVPSAQELEKVDLLQLSQGDAAHVR